MSVCACFMFLEQIIKKKKKADTDFIDVTA